jgi:hypothetical protein
MMNVIYGTKVYSALSGLFIFRFYFTGLYPVLIYFTLSELNVLDNQKVSW